MTLTLGAARLCPDCDVLTEVLICPVCARNGTVSLAAWLRPLDSPPPASTGRGAIRPGVTRAAGGTVVRRGQRRGPPGRRGRVGRSGSEGQRPDAAGAPTTVAPVVGTIGSARG